jgi:hypothetical protein
MKIVGCDFHPSYQQIAVLDTETGEVWEKKLSHGNGEAEKFYRALQGAALIGMEATGNARWFELVIEKLGHELWIGDAAKIRASYVFGTSREETRSRRNDNKRRQGWKGLLQLCPLRRKYTPAQVPGSR